MEQSDTVVVVAAGGGPDVRTLLPDGAVVIAADGGLDRAWELGLTADVVVGDLDSVDDDLLVAARAGGTRVERHPEAKDATDLELALTVALERSPRRIVVVASAGGRLDHLLALLLQLGAPLLADVEVDALVGDALVHVIRTERALGGRPGELLTLLAHGGPATGVTTEGLEYALSGETLEPGSTRGVSNVFTGDTARVSLEEGVLLAIRPDPRREA